MKQYNFQIREPHSRCFWDEVPYKSRQLPSRGQAVTLAQRTARRYKTVVRLTEGLYPFRASGSYFHGQTN